MDLLLSLSEIDNCSDLLSLNIWALISSGLHEGSPQAMLLSKWKKDGIIRKRNLPYVPNHLKHGTDFVFLLF